MIYIDNNTTGFTIPRITNGIGDKVILINQITKRTFELSTDVLNDVGYKVDITDLKLEIGQYDYVVKKNNIPLESGILQVGGYEFRNNQYEVDFNIIQYEPDTEYIPLPERILDVTENGIYDVDDYNKVDVKVDLSLIEELENSIAEKNQQIQTLQTENTNLQQQIEEKEGNISELEAQIEENNSLIESLQQDVDNLNQQIVDMRASFEEQYNILLQENEDLHNQVVQKDGEIENLNTQIESVTSLNVTENGIYTPEEGTLGWNNVDVNISYEKPVFKAVNGTRFSTDSTELPIDIDSMGVTDFYGMFSRCINLTTVPLIDTSKGEIFDEMFSRCENLTTIPSLDTSNGTNFTSMFYDCKSLTTAPLIDTSNGTILAEMFAGCCNLTTISQLDTSNCNNFSSMFAGCYNLTTISQLDTSKGVYFSRMFEGCTDILSGTTATIPPLDTSNGYDFSRMFCGCTYLKTIPPLDTSNGYDFSRMFEGCNYLKTIPPLDLSKGNNFSGMFDTFLGFTEYLQNVQFIGSINYSISFSSRTRLTYESVKSILTACSNTTKPTTSKTLTFNRTLTDQNGELQSLIEICTSKGWTISGLTLE